MSAEDAQRLAEEIEDIAPAALAHALLACRDELQRIADALEAPRREPSYRPDRDVGAPELPDLELLAEAANDARILAQHRGDEADARRARRRGRRAAQKYNALWLQLAREEEIDPRCGAPLYKIPAEAAPGPGVAARKIEAVCFLQQGHHGSHRSDRGHIWS